jgi:hypothetical protein
MSDSAKRHPMELLDGVQPPAAQSRPRDRSDVTGDDGWISGADLQTRNAHREKTKQLQ